MERSPPQGSSQLSVRWEGGHSAAPGRGGRQQEGSHQTAGGWSKVNIALLAGASLFNTTALIFLTPREGLQSTWFVTRETWSVDGEHLEETLFSNSKEILEVLLATNPQLNCCDSRGDPPLHLAVRAGHLKVATRLLARGADIQARWHGGAANAGEVRCPQFSAGTKSQDSKKVHDHSSPGVGRVTAFCTALQRLHSCRW